MSLAIPPSAGQTNASQKKAALVAAYKELGAAFARASVAATDFASLVGDAETGEVFHLMENLPVALPNFGGPAVEGKGKGRDADEEASGKKEKKVKKVKDPNAPKRPPSAYLEFQNAVRNKFREEDPDLAYADILKKIADVWKNMPDTERKTWQDITSEKTVDYEAAKAAYEAEHPNGADVAMSDILVSSVGKDGKEYTGKKRGRKSNAEKAALAAASAADGSDPSLLQEIAQATIGADASKKEKKAAKKAAAEAAAAAAAAASTPKKKIPVKAPSPEEDSEEDDDDEEEEEETSSEEESDSDDEEAVAEQVQPKKVNGSASKGKRPAEVEKSDKKKKNKTA
ncbi:hypothetical protein MNV49_002048 [Pseudohyphozyma bogoriensis]|nr:hypothetical protein MNV49_002048 [Pseudohyphozyma bogoriensis]